MRAVRIIGPALLASHLLLRLLNQSLWSELLLYNVIGIFAVVSIFMAPHVRDLMARNVILIGVSVWVVGSVLASLSNFYSLPGFATTSTKFLYLFFYPFIFNRDCTPNERKSPAQATGYC